MSQKAEKKGKEFEALVAWISQCLHSSAIVTPNDKIRDRDTNRLRQVDISIRLKDGPTEFLGIVEVRDRSRPVGEDYLEQVKQKKESVNADSVIVVSSSGFYESAIRKAKALNIRLFTYTNAIKSDWKGCLQFTEMKQFIPRWDNPKITFLDHATNQVIDPSPALLAKVTSDPRSLVLEDVDGNPCASLLQIFADVLTQHHDRFFPASQFGKPTKRDGAVVNIKVQSPIFFEGKDGKKHELNRVFLEADFWFEERSSPVSLSRYNNGETGTTLAEIASTTIQGWDGNLKLDFMAKFLGKSGEEGTQLLLRATKVESK